MRPGESWGESIGAKRHPGRPSKKETSKLAATPLAVPTLAAAAAPVIPTPLFVSLPATGAAAAGTTTAAQQDTTAKPAVPAAAPLVK